MKAIKVYGVILKGEVVDFKNKQKPFWVKAKDVGEAIGLAQKKCGDKLLCVYWVYPITDKNYDKYAFAEGEIEARV